MGNRLSEKSEQEKRDKKFEKLSEEFKDAITGSSTDEIRKRVSDIALLEATERETLAMDPDVNQAKDALKELVEPYRENLKSFKLQIEYCKWVLEQKGIGARVGKAADDEMQRAIEKIKNPGKGVHLASVTVGGKTIEFAPPDATDSE